MATLQVRIQPALDVRDASLEPTAILPKSKRLPLNVTSIPRASGLLSKLELDLTESYDATDLLQKLALGEVSSVTLLTAFIKRATIAQQCTNCLTELIPEALNDARACDDYFSKTGKPIGPLHGLPISVKEQIAVRGLRTNAGFVAWVNNVVDEDSDIVRSLKKLGAVIFARTNQPQSLMHLETSNNIYGATVHPENRDLTAGGSTGGEAALMAMGGTPLGIGGDIGGSIRVPAAYNGIYGFLPTPGRISGEGVVIPTPGSDAISGTLGPFARSLRDIELFCTAYSSALPWVEDRSLIPGDILGPTLGGHLSQNRRLRVGFMFDNGVVSPLPPVRRVLSSVTQRLMNSADIELVPFVPWDHAKAWSIIAANYFEDTGEDIRKKCAEGDEPLEPLTEWILEQCEHSTRAVGKTLQERKAARDAYRRAYATHWNKSGIDVLVSPVTPGTAPPLGTSKYWAYTAVWNLLSYPAIAIPASKLVGEANHAKDLKAETYVPKNDIEAHLLRCYSPETSAGMPVGLQVVAPRLHESMLMKACYIIEEALKVNVLPGISKSKM